MPPYILNCTEVSATVSCVQQILNGENYPVLAARIKIQFEGILDNPKKKKKESYSVDRIIARNSGTIM